MEKKIWNEENGGWDYSNKQKKQIRAIQMRIEAKEMKKKKNEQRKNAVILKKMETIDELTKFEESAEMVEILDFQNETNKTSSKTWWWWTWW